MAHLTLDKSNYQAFTGGLPLNLDPREFDILWLLAEKPGKTYKGKDLYEELKKLYPLLKENPFKKYLHQLQNKLNQKFIQVLEEDRYRIAF
ncbi:MAG: DNA-binding response OmpR family regulator [Saprospiraceae bacterium]|jgi:DNA-binding response OmpR family regulator